MVLLSSSVSSFREKEVHYLLGCDGCASALTSLGLYTEACGSHNSALWRISPAPSILLMRNIHWTQNFSTAIDAYVHTFYWWDSRFRSSCNSRAIMRNCSILSEFRLQALNFRLAYMVVKPCVVHLCWLCQISIAASPNNLHKLVSLNQHGVDSGKLALKRKAIF